MTKLQKEIDRLDNALENRKDEYSGEEIGKMTKTLARLETFRSLWDDFKAIPTYFGLLQGEFRPGLNGEFRRMDPPAILCPVFKEGTNIAEVERWFESVFGPDALRMGA